MGNEAATGSNDSSLTTTVVSGIVIVLAIVSVALRFYARYFTKTNLGLDDWLILLAMFATLAVGILLLCATVIDPSGTALIDNTDPTYVYTPANVLHLKLSFIASIIYFTITGASKLSVLFMYNRLFNIDQPFRIQAIVVGTLVLAYWIGCTVASLLNCIPLEWSWLNNQSDPKYCFNFNIFWMASGAAEAVLDAAILFMPIRIVLSLRLSKRKKFTVCCVFSLGAFAMGSGLVKVILGYVPGSRVPSYSRTEVWSIFHVGMSIVCASLPIFKPLIKRVGRIAKVMGLSAPSFRNRSYENRPRSLSHGWSSLGANQGDVEQGQSGEEAGIVLENVHVNDHSDSNPSIDLAAVQASGKTPHSSWLRAPGPMHLAQ